MTSDARGEPSFRYLITDWSVKFEVDVNVKKKMVKFPVSRRKKARAKLGKITRNPFLNFLRYFRKTSGGLPMAQVTKNAGKQWRTMTERDRSPYRNMARKAPLRKKSPKKGTKRKRRKSKKRCSRRDFWEKYWNSGKTLKLLYFNKKTFCDG